MVSKSLSVHSTSAVQKFVEKIDVRGRAMHVTLPPPIGSVTGYHLFIVYTQKHGKQFVCQGLPFDPEDHRFEIRCYIRDPDGYIIEVGQSKIA
jgi:hypothetical protein